jgi:hypothetical protein
LGKGRGGGTATKQERKKRFFFFEKKKQKTFEYLASDSPDRLSPDQKKFFGSFFQKRTAFFYNHQEGA